MSLTFAKVKEIVAPYADSGGKCASASGVGLFAREVLEHLLLFGDYGSLRKFCFITENGVFTAPPELEAPLKIKIDNQVGQIWNSWFSYHSVSSDWDEGCFPAEKVLIEEPYYFPTTYDVPRSGSIVGVVGGCDEDDESFVIVQGQDASGKEVVTYNSKGEQITGEIFKIKKNNLRYGKVKFTKITNVVKSTTKGYVRLYAVDVDKNSKSFLAEYSPLEEIPMYKRFKVNHARCAKGKYTHVSILGRIRLKENYTDYDVVPFESTIAIKLAAQRLQSEDSNDIQTANYKKEALKEMIEAGAEFKKTPGDMSVDIFADLSGAAIKNII